MIRIENVSFAYRNTSSKGTLVDVDVHIPKGQVVLLCGESGSGKTTFTRLINGLIPNYYGGELNGKVLLKDKDVGKVPLHELASCIGSIFQNPKSQFYTLLTDTEIVFACENLGYKKDEILKRFSQTVEAFQIEKLLGKNLFQLSGGEKQLIACASVHALMPEVLVLDEPTSNLDIRSINKLKSVIRCWKEQGKTILIAEHRLKWLQGIADRVIYFDGVIKMDIPADEFWEIPTMKLQEMGLRMPEDFMPKCRKHFTEYMEVTGFVNEVLHIDKMHIPVGATIALLGNNGVGKTTFVKMLCGLSKNKKAMLTYQGKCFSSKKRLELCYMVMQDVNCQLFTENVSGEILLGIDTLNTEEKKVILETILEELDLSEFRNIHPMSLSGGQRQRVAVAGALASQREIIVYDEPTSGLDYRHMTEVANNIQKLSEQGKTQIIITHDAELVEECCDYYMFMEEGRIMAYGEWDEDDIGFVKNFFT